MELSGEVGGIPYDLRRPTLARIRERMWNPGDPRVIVPRVFGAGWTFNLAALRERSRLGFAAVLVLYAVIALNVIRSLKKALSDFRA